MINFCYCFLNIGVYNHINSSESTRLIRKINKIVPFPTYNPIFSKNFDIALLKLDEALPLTDPSRQYRPICLPELLEDNTMIDVNKFANKTCTATGWERMAPCLYLIIFNYN